MIKLTNQPSPQTLTLKKGSQPLPLIFSEADDALVQLAAKDLAEAIETTSGQTLQVESSIPPSAECIVLVGSLQKNPWIQELVEQGALSKTHLENTWEQWQTCLVENPFPGIQKALVIAGSDRRGTAYGVYECTRILGVSPWSWWADAPVKQHACLHLEIEGGHHLSQPPRVKYRAFYINDEIFGLLPWARENVDPSFQGIGHKTYEKVFQLMVRLRTNYLWPALKKSSQPFSTDPLNREMADRYGIVVGGSHAEPLTMCTYEWDWTGETRGDWNYKTNQTGVLKFMEEKVAENKKYENIYTLGMRGRDDVPMEGADDIIDASRILASVIKDQRDILTRQLNKPIEEIPQSLTVYKEVLKQYDMGLKVPDDITLIWTDDNFGYFKRLPGCKEKKRSGGNGAYYHLSYLGRPHDYLWLESTPPQLVLNELKKAADCGADRIWVINIGDLKPLEYNIQLCSDLAWDPDAISSDTLRDHMEAFYAENVDPAFASQIADVRWGYFALAMNRKPEHMAWSRIEQDRAPCESRFSHIHELEAERREAQCLDLLTKSAKVYDALPEEAKDSYFQLVHYPVIGAAQTNIKWLNASKAEWYHRQNRSTAQDTRQAAYDAWQSIWSAIQHYEALQSGKWKHYIGMFPMEVHKSPVFSGTKRDEWIEPESFESPLFEKQPSTQEWGIWCQGEEEHIGIQGEQSTLPALIPWQHKGSFFEIFTTGDAPIEWSLTCDQESLVFSQTEGTLSGQCRITVHLDRNKLAKAITDTATIHIVTNKGRRSIRQPVFNPSPETELSAGTYIETRGVISIPAVDYCHKTETAPYFWKKIEGLGINGSVIKACPESATPLDHEWGVSEKSPYLQYAFHTFNRGWVTINIYTLPTHIVSKEHGAAYAVSINNHKHDGPTLVHDQACTLRHEGFMERVEQGFTRIESRHYIRKPGKQNLRIYMCDPGILFDHIQISFAHAPDTYLPIPATKVEPE